VHHRFNSVVRLESEAVRRDAACPNLGVASARVSRESSRDDDRSATAQQLQTALVSDLDSTASEDRDLALEVGHLIALLVVQLGTRRAELQPRPTHRRQLHDSCSPACSRSRSRSCGTYSIVEEVRLVEACLARVAALGEVVLAIDEYAHLLDGRVDLSLDGRASRRRGCGCGGFVGVSVLYVAQQPSQRIGWIPYTILRSC